MKMYYDIQATLHISSNLMFYEKSKHVQIDCHFIWEQLLSKEIYTELLDQLIN